MKRYIDKILILSIALFFIGDLLAKISNFYFDSKFYRIAGFLKLGFELILILAVIINFKKIKILVYPAIFVLLFLVGCFSLKISFSDILQKWSTENLYFLNNFLFVFLFIAATKLIGLKKDTFSRILYLFKVILYVNAIFIFAGVLFEIEFFKTYPLSSRFGYNGIFAKNGEASYFYMLLITILYYKNQVEKTNNWSEFFLIIFVTLFIGKKVIFLYLALFAVYHFLFIHRYKIRFRLVFVATLAVAFFLKDVILNAILNYSEFWKNVDENYGLLGALTSTRSLLFEKAMAHISENWNMINYLVGGINYKEFKVEGDYIDLFLFFGIIGVVVYSIFLKKYLFSETNNTVNALLLIILICSIFSGGLFMSVSCMVLLYITFYELNNIGLKNVELKE